jgi:hypothetical protein
MMMIYLFGLATGLALSSLTACLLWPFYVQRCRLPGETWAEARDRELARLDALAEEEPETMRSVDERWLK